MRALILLPIIHSPADLGTLSGAAEDSRNEAQKLQYLDAVEHFWTVVNGAIDGMSLNYPQLKVYQDSLPVCDLVDTIVADVAASGSKNYALLKTLQEKGATLMGTESPDLLRQEKDLMTEVLQSADHSKESAEKAQALLLQRDRFMAQRINESLADEEMGLIFVGLMHQIEPYLAADIVVIKPLGEPSGIGG
jgi:pheromone shutdown protein TraB